jgi:hypothetical protein
MERGPVNVLTAQRAPVAPVGPVRAPGRRSLRRALADLRDSCALCLTALLGCLALVLVGALVSLVWTFLVEG